MAIKFEEKTKTYTVSYSKRHPKTRQPISLRRKKIKSKAEANRVYRELILQVEDKIRRKITPTWGKVLDEYSNFLFNSNVSVNTAENYILCLKKYTLPGWDPMLVTDIGTLDIRNLINDKVGHRSPSHQKSVLKFIRGAFNFACEKGYLGRNPTPVMKFKIGRKLEGVLTEPQVEKLLNQAKLMECEWYPIWCAALYTGMRSGELFALTWDKVNFDTRKILVNCSWNSKDGFKSTKSGDDRNVDIAPNLLLILKELKLNSLEHPFVFPRIEKWEKGRQAEDLRMFLTGLGLPDIRFHDLRATWATILLSKGIPPIKVMRMGGWREMNTMERYTRLAGVDVEGIAGSLDLHNPIASDSHVIEFTKYP